MHDLSNLFISEFVKSEYAAKVGITNIDEVNILPITTYDGFSKAMSNPLFNVSLGWSDSPVLFDNLADEGAISPITNLTLIAEINNTYPLILGNSKMRSYDDNNDLLWAATSFSSYGFTVNHDVLQERGLSVPTTWEDLASPEFFTSVSQPNIGMANAPDSVSTSHIYQIILQKYGWERGWQIINNMAGNGKIYGGPIEALSSIVLGETAAALTIDHYGFMAMSQNSSIEYIIPDNGTQIVACPIAYSKVPPHQAAADAFIKFVLSSEGQALWLNETVNRLPIREDAFDTDYANERDDIDLMYNMYNKTLSNLYIQFNETLALQLEEVMRPHFEYTITDVHTKLGATWAELVNDYRAGGMDKPRFDEINDYFGKAAINQTEAIEWGTYFEPPIIDSSNKWSIFANEKFDFVLKMIEDDNLSAPGDQNTKIEDTTTSDGVSLISSTTTDSTDSELLPFNFDLVILIMLLLPILRKRKNPY